MNQKNEPIFLRYKPNDFSAKEDFQVQQDMPGITAVKVLGLKESQLWRIQSDREGLFPPTNNTILQSTGRLIKAHKEYCSVREAGVEPACLSALDPKSSASANFATLAHAAIF